MTVSFSRRTLLDGISCVYKNRNTKFTKFTTILMQLMLVLGTGQERKNAAFFTNVSAKIILK
jgi:hypothetical protein